MKNVLIFILSLMFVNCSFASKVSKESYPTPEKFRSPYSELEQFYSQGMKDKTLNWMQAYETTYYELIQLSEKLKKEGILQLYRGQSYTFVLEAFCKGADTRSIKNGISLKKGKSKQGIHLTPDAKAIQPSIKDAYESNAETISISPNVKANPEAWVLDEKGYFYRATTVDKCNSVRLDFYVPDNLSSKGIQFNPIEWVLVDLK